MKVVELHLLHGFLGRPIDWQSFEDELSRKAQGHGLYLRVIRRNLWSDIEKIHQAGPYGVQAYYDLWARLFEKEICSGAHLKIFMGYSLGARLLMHIQWHKVPQLLKVFLVSGHPGLTSTAHRNERRMGDLLWADDFLSEPWDPLMDRWQKQGVFSEDKPVVRHEVHYNRETLSHCFVHLGLGLQEPFNPSETVKKHIHWICGDEDKKYVDLIPRMKNLLPESQIHSCQGGHRLIQSNPGALADILWSTLKSAKENGSL